MKFNEWLDTLIEEKNLDTESAFEVEGPEWDWRANEPEFHVCDSFKEGSE